jgi:Ran-binding protein 9/10
MKSLFYLAETMGKDNPLYQPLRGMKLICNSHIGVGFCRSSFTLNKLPGWEPESWGYHGDDGYTFCSQGVGKTYGPTFTTGDVVGCCINFRKRIAFYTKNGVELDTAFRDLTFDTPGRTTKGDFWPAVGFRTPGEHLRINFGQKPFVFDIEAYILVRLTMESLANVASGRRWKF